MPFHDLRIAIRHLSKSPGITTTAVLMLALGIGATTAIFSVVESVLLRPLPFPHPERLVTLGDIVQGANWGGNAGASVTAPDIPAYTRDTHSFENLLLPLTQVQSMEHTVSESEAPRRFNTVLISTFAIAAVLLAALGIYSVIAFSAALREQEMAIRMALGSQRAGILALVFTSASKLALAGCVLGLLGAAAASHLLRSLVFDVSPFDPLVLTLAAVLVLILALAASLLPARRAASIDPMKALRAD